MHDRIPYMTVTGRGAREREPGAAAAAAAAVCNPAKQLSRFSRSAFSFIFLHFIHILFSLSLSLSFSYIYIIYTLIILFYISFFSFSPHLFSLLLLLFFRCPDAATSSLICGRGLLGASFFPPSLFGSQCRNVQDQRQTRKKKRKRAVLGTGWSGLAVGGRVQ